MISRPFSIRCVDTTPAGKLALAMRFADGATPDDDGLRLVQRLMGHFVEIGGAGALSGSRITPTDSGLVLGAERIAADLCAWRFEQVHVAAETRIVLENLVHFIHLNVSPVTHLDLAMDAGNGMMQVQHEPPRLYVPPPFQCVVEPEAAEVVIDIDLAGDAVEEGLREQFVQLWDSWLFVAAAGGFESEDFTSRSVTIFPASEADSLSDRISLFMDDVGVAEASFDALINGFHRLHYTVAPIQDLHIY
ncbi:MAG TPA: hypothetical protein VGD52_03130 [Pseudoduganella sp.]